MPPKGKSGQRIVSVELTRQCNNFCQHCYNYWRTEGRHTGEGGVGGLSRKDIKHLIGKVSDDIPLRYVALSGGEPLLRPDLPLIVSDLVEMDLQPIIITNGVLLTESILKKLPAGIHFEVSLLGPTETVHDAMTGNKGSFEKVIQNVSRINRYDSYFTMGFVASRLNALSVGKTVELGIALGARGVMYNRVNLSSGTKSYAHKIVPPLDMLRRSLHSLQEVVHKYQVQSVCSVPIPPCLIEISDYPNIGFGWCPRGGKNAYYTIGCDGFLRPCNHSSVSLGNLREFGFKEIISGKVSRQFWRSSPVECKGCDHPLKQECRGGCPAAAMEFYGIADRIDPICDLVRGTA